jgi:excisionase family DNA binding protein
MQRLLSVDEAADRLHISANTLRFLRQEGRFARATKVGRRLFWYEADLEEWLQEQKEPA